MTLSITDLFTPATVDEWETFLLTTATSLGLSTTSWQPGGMARTIIAMLARALAASDSIVSTMAQGGFLDFAAAVTDDPATLGTAAKPGWLDLLASSVYDVTRQAATFADGTMSIVNASASTYGPFASGSYHVAYPSTGATYHNTATLTIGPSTTTTGAFEADVVGAGGTSGPGAITSAVTSLIGVTVTNPLAFVGANAQSNAGLVAKCRAKLAALSPNGPGGAYIFFALQADAILRALVPPQQLANGPITRVLETASKLTGTVTTTIANATGAVPGVSNLAITGATNTSPIVITVGSTTGISNGDTVLIGGVEGNTAANGYWTVANITGTTFELAGSTGNGTYISSTGVAEAGDLGLVDSVIQANCVPQATTAVTQSAVATTVTIVANVFVPVSLVGQVTSAVNTALTNYFATLPIGGLTDPGGAYTQVLPFDAVVGVIYGAMKGIQQVTLLLNGGTSNISLAPLYVAVLSPPTINVYGV